MQQVYPHSVLFQLNNRQWLTKSFDDPAIRTSANKLLVLTDPPGVSDLTHTECKVTLSCATTIGSWDVFVKGIHIRSSNMSPALYYFQGEQNMKVVLVFHSLAWLCVKIFKKTKMSRILIYCITMTNFHISLNNSQIRLIF